MIKFFKILSYLCLVSSLAACNPLEAQPTPLPTPDNSDLKNTSLPLIVFDGNSLTVGFPVEPKYSYPSQVENLLGANYRYRNFGVSGQTTETMAEDARSQIDGLINPARKTNILVAWEITNDLYYGENGLENAYHNFVKYCQERRMAGWKVIVLTVLPRSDARAPASFASDYQIINDRLRQNWSNFADGLVDVARDKRLGIPGAELDTTYFDPDRVHLNAKGYSLIANAVTPAILKLVNS